jgi:adenylate cyclase
VVVRPEGPNRRLAAILSADVVGYSRLMAEDEAATVWTLTAYRKEIQGLVGDHRGRVVDATGDDLLAEFPTALDAVECAVEIQRVVGARNAGLPEDHRMEFRIGVHLGDVTVEDERLYGDGVNIAARLQALAEPGGVCISAEVYGQVRHKLELGYADLGEQSVKNIPDPVHAYRVRESATAGLAQPKRGARRAILVGGVGVLVALALAIGIQLTLRTARLSGPPITTIAVLPFEDMSPGGGQTWLGDGMAEELIEMLSRVEELSVIARTSSFVLRGADIETVGAKLGVGSIVEGSVRRVDDQLRITAQLIRVSDGSHVWAARYDRAAEDVLAAQSAIAREIAEGVRTGLGIPFDLPRSDAMQRYLPRDVRAYQLWRQAYIRMSTLAEEGLLQGREYLLHALEIDPEYAQAWALLGWNHQNLWNYGYDWSEERRSDARAAALRALELDPANGLAHELLGFQAVLRNDYEDCERIYTAALKAHPSHPGLLSTYSLLLAETGRYQAALRNAQRSAELDPLWAHRHRQWSEVLLLMGDYDAAIEKARRALEMNPQEPLVHRHLALCYHLNGMDEAALEALIRRDPASELLLRRGFSAGGHAGMVRAVIEQWGEAGTPCGRDLGDLDELYFAAEMYALAGEADSMYGCLDRFIDRLGHIFYLAGHPPLAPYRDDPRFIALLRRMNLAE